LEAEATAILNFEPLLVPGLLQTADYTHAVMRAGGVPDVAAQPRVAARLGRQSILTRDEPPTLHAIVDEGVLRRVLGSPRVMTRQLRHLVEVAERPAVTLQVVPLASKDPAGPVLVFTRESWATFVAAIHAGEFDHR
jgi:hypothetical protein